MAQALLSVLEYGRRFGSIFLPHLGNLPIASIRTAMVAMVVERNAARETVETAKRVLPQISSVFGFGMAKSCAA